MLFIKIAAIGFLLLESTNILALYFFPETKLANAVGIFTAWEKSKNDPEMHAFVKYLVNWVAGTKLIFILLWIVLLAFAGDRAIVFAAVSMVISIASFFWRLFPLIRSMDKAGQIEPQNYSLALGWMIGGFILVFSIAVILSLL